MKKKNLLLICVLSIVIIFSIVFLNKSDVKGIYDDSTGVYTNRYLNFEIATPPLLYIDKEFSSQNRKYGEVNLLRLKNYLYDEQDINSKMDITCTATKLDDEFEVYLRDTFNTEQNKLDVKVTSEEKREGQYITKEFSQNNWNYKMFIREENGYALKIKIAYTDKENKDAYLGYINYFSDIK